MALRTNFNSESNTFTIQAEGVFDGRLIISFNKALEEITPTMHIIEFDLALVDTIDSVGLGMLLILHEEAINNKQIVKLINMQPEMRNILKLVNFDKIFNFNCSVNE